MKILSLIKQLENLYEQHGNKSVNIFVDAIASELNRPATTTIDSVEYDEDDKDIFIRANY